MKIEIINIGDELLSGKTINSNAKYLCETLFANGYKTHYTSVLPDDKKELQKGIKLALDRATLVIVTGGLGPTLDDNTKKIVCNLLKIPLKYRADIALDIETRFGKIASIEEQATIPQSGYVFKNEVGTAPGFAFLNAGKVIILLPGVPSELKNMFQKHALTFIQKHFPLDKKIYQEFVNICMLPEIKVDAFLRTCQIPNDVKIGIYPSPGIINISITTSAKNEKEANKKTHDLKKRLLTEFQDYIFLSKNNKIEEAIHDILIIRDEKIAFAESCTGGVLSSRITALPGSSKYFLGSFITYANEMKQNILKVSKKTLNEKGAVSIETVGEMTKGVFDLTDATYVISVSGIAGPTGGSLEKPVGTICLAVAKRNDVIDAGILHLKNSRASIIEETANRAFGILFRRIKHNLLYFQS